ncbi:asparagine synthase (glutamine-hydrolyzing) [Halopseudomonas sp.]|uniref:asparagine synthase (glutamine-hydrolyzing) n=1 Tax=Halopseudomonas sp. TaxID=2901191 RepID=UPI00311DA350
MCGIFGFADPGTEASEQVCSVILEYGFSAIGPRGPDSRGLFKVDLGGQSYAMAHTRLAVIDLSPLGRQPMTSPDSNWCMSYNGEIYNYLEVREELKGAGWSFSSDSDSEVFLKAWCEWGLESLHKLNGMFAASFLDLLSGDIWLVRDRYGVKPLYWSHVSGGGMAFSSSPALLAKGLSAPVNVGYCARGARYKVFEVDGEDSPFEGVSSVGAGCWVRYQPGSLEATIVNGKWYDLAEAVSKKEAQIKVKSDDEVLEECRYILENAIAIRTRSDVPVAVSLSGGLDSTTVAAYASKKIENLVGFNYGSPFATSSEGPLVSSFSDNVGIRARYIWPNFSSNDLDDLLESTLTAQQAPFVGMSVLAQHQVFKEVRAEGVKVLLGGQGGDEIFAGYRKFFIVAALSAIRQRDVRGVMSLLSSLAVMLIHEVRQYKVYLQALGRYSNRDKVAFNILSWDVCSLDLWGGGERTLSSRQIEDVQNFSIPTLLRYEDRNSMGNGVESRLPFMDYRLVEFALALPAKFKLANGYGKWIVRKVTAGLVSDDVRLNRMKRGFDVTQSWINDGLGESLRARISSNRHLLDIYLKEGVNLNRFMTGEAMSRDRNVLDELLMLAWLVDPYRLPSAGTEES